MIELAEMKEFLLNKNKSDEISNKKSGSLLEIKLPLAVK